MATWTDLLNDESVRLRLLLLVMLAGLGGLAAAFWDIQVRREPEFQSSEFRQSMRQVRLPGPRGSLWDRKGTLLVGNRPSYGIAIYVEELRQRGPLSNTVDRVEGVLDLLSRRLELPRAVSRDDILVHVRKRRPLPLLAWRDIDERAMARWAETADPLPGVDLFAEPARYYPDPDVAPHVLGHVGRLDPDDQAEQFDYYLPDMEGRSGMERALNARLSGRAGGRLLQVDASGFTHREFSAVAPRPGEDVILTLDLDVQRMVERELAGERGACVILDPRNGDVLALASAPDYRLDDLRFVSRYAQMAADPDRPFVNRAIAGVYPPGSIFKPLVAIAAFESGRVDAHTVVDCPGYFAIGNFRINCWRREGHGPLALRKAIEQSCNTYFCAVAAQCGHARVHQVGEALGLGRRTGIELPGESTGLMPDAAWKERVHHDGWRPGDTANASIGQGFVLVTPIQMAMFGAALANGGMVYRPRLVADARAGDLIRQLRWPPATLALLHAGMVDVVNGPSGTGRRAAVPGMTVAGKTGSAEYGPRERRRKYAWMLAYAPAEAPRYVVVVVLEDSVSGGLSAAPRVQRLLAGLLALEQGLRFEPEAQG